MRAVSKKARYALHGLAFVAEYGRSEPVSFNRILGYLRAYSQRLSLSPSYIAKVFQEISRAGFTTAVSGPRGGYQLARPAGSIRVIEVVEALDGPLLSDCCLLSVGQCDRQSTCGVGGMIREAEQAFHRFLKRETIGSLGRKMEFPDLGTIRSFAPGGKDPRRSRTNSG